MVPTMLVTIVANNTASVLAIKSFSSIMVFSVPVWDMQMAWLLLAGEHLPLTQPQGPPT